MDIYAALGWVGTIGVLSAYWWSSRTGRMRPFHVANVIGSTLLVISNIPVRAWPALTLSAAFGAIGAYGLFTEHRERRRPRRAGRG